MAIAGAGAVVADLRWLEALRVTFARARKEGVPTVLDVDLGGREALGEVLRLTDYAIFSEPALEEIAPGAEQERKLRRVLALGAKHAGVTLGARGYLWVDAAGTGRQPAYAVDAVDTTGAGDAFHGAFALGLVGDFEEVHAREVEHAGHDVGWEHRQGLVVLAHVAVVVLAREADLVFGADQFFLQLAEVGVSLELRVGLGQREQPAKRLGQRTLGLGVLSHGLGAGGLVVAGRAKDNIGIDRVELYIDGQLVDSTTAAQFRFQNPLTGLAAGKHKVRVRAYDTGGNAAWSSTVLIRKQA